MARPDKTFPHIIFQEDDQTVYGKGWTGATALFAGHHRPERLGLSTPTGTLRGYFAEPIHPSEWPNDGKRIEVLESRQNGRRLPSLLHQSRLDFNRA